MLYDGPDRRVHTCFVTRNREYHTRSGVCVAVRDRYSSAWMAGHRAVGLDMVSVPLGTIYVGYPLEFTSSKTRVRTSAVIDILRPGRNQVDTYRLVNGFQPGWAI